MDEHLCVKNQSGLIIHVVKVQAPINHTPVALFNVDSAQDHHAWSIEIPLATRQYAL